MAKISADGASGGGQLAVPANAYRQQLHAGVERDLQLLRLVRADMNPGKRWMPTDFTPVPDTRATGTGSPAASEGTQHHRLT